MASQYGTKLDPYRKLRSAFGVRGVRQTVVVTNNPSTIDQNQILLVRFPNLGANDVIVPGTAKLAFNISLTSKDANRTLVNNIGRALVKKIAIKMEGNEIQSIDDADVWLCYNDLWKTTKEREDAVYQGIENANTTALRIGAGNKSTSVAKDKAISDTFGNRFCIPLDFELLETHMPFYQGALSDRLSYEMTFNDYARVIKTANDAVASYEISGIALEFDMVTNADLARMIRNQYETKLSILYDRILRHRRITVNKEDTVWNINLNTPANSMKGILLVFEDIKTAGKDWNRDTEKFYNPKITKVTATIEGIPNQLYASGMLPYQHWNEIRRYFADGQFRTAVGISKEFHLSDVSLSDYLTDNYSLWLDMRSTDDNSLHGTGRRIENGSEGITLQLEKTSEAAGVLNCYVYVVTDASLNIQNGRFVKAAY